MEEASGAMSSASHLSRIDPPKSPPLQLLSCVSPPVLHLFLHSVCVLLQRPTSPGLYVASTNNQRQTSSHDSSSALPLGMQNAMQCTRPPLPPHDPSFLDTRNNKPFLDCNQTKLVPYRVLLFAVKQSLLLDVRIFQAQTNHGTLSHLSYLPLSRCQP